MIGLSVPDIHANRPQLYSAETWLAMRPLVEYYYIEADLTLSEVREKLLREHGFHASEQMYKKRLRKWRLSKTMKAGDKDAVISRILEHASARGIDDSANTSKILRYAKESVRAGRLSPGELADLIRIIRTRQRSKTTVQTASLALPENHLGKDLNLPNDQANIERLFRSVTEATIFHNQHNPTGRFQGADNLLLAFEQGRSAWKVHAFSKARRHFTNAGSLIVDMLSRGEVPSSIILRNMIPGIWRGHRDLFESFAGFIVRSLQTSLPSSHPLVIAIQMMRLVPESPQRDATIWDCVFDAYSLTKYNQDEFHMIASMRARSCRGLGDKARLRTCTANAIARLQAESLKADDVKIDEKFWLASMHVSEQRRADAENLYKQVGEIERERDDKKASHSRIEPRPQITSVGEDIKVRPQRPLNHFEEALCKSWSSYELPELKAESLRFTLFFREDCHLAD